MRKVSRRKIRLSFRFLSTVKMSGKIVLSADLGGTNLRTAIVSQDGEILYRTQRETPRGADASAIVAALIEAANDCFRAVKIGGEIAAFAAAVPATVNADAGIVLKAPNLPQLDDFNICATLEKKFGLPCLLENDANAAAIGENWLGASRTIGNSIFVTLGTGVGGGIILGGKILRGADGTAGEIGHLAVEPFGAPCGCGSRGCVEQYASASALVRMARELGAQFTESDLSKIENPTALEIYQSGAAGDALAREAFRRQGFYLGIALAGLINALNPEMIVIGGGAADGWDLFAPAMLGEINKRAYRAAVERAKIVRARLGDDAGILGAARLAFD